LSSSNSLAGMFDKFVKFYFFFYYNDEFPVVDSAYKLKLSMFPLIENGKHSIKSNNLLSFVL